MSDLDGKSIVLGVTGGIAAYKAATIASLLVQEGARVDVVMTKAAQRFIRPLSFPAITHRPVHSDPFAMWHDDFAGHVSLAQNANLLLVAPATAASIARIALGLGDDMLGLIALSTAAPVVLAPAMEEGMLHHPSTKLHLSTLAQRGVRIVDPEHGRLASGAIGQGRMASPESIVVAAKDVLRRSAQLAGRSLVITAGGTREPLDPVRYIGNRSSGAMGFALAAAAAAAGADVTLISGESALRPPLGAAFVQVTTAAEMRNAVAEATVGADALIMAAAVADFRPETSSKKKLKKSADQEYLDVRLIRNPDILASIAHPNLLKIGFAAETDHHLEDAAQKPEAEGLAMMIANDAEATIGSSNSTATILMADGEVTALPTMTKEALATEIMARVAALLNRAKSHTT